MEPFTSKVSKIYEGLDVATGEKERPVSVMDMSLEELENCNPYILQEKSFQFCFKKLN